ncbi:hypothetical protein JZ751_004137 [Albula glossodonta]|uniref:ACB domain-containing protein n=1 Tax=Albula glossodonta TaxID=121402 RepID=A0A8T2PF56_9TELE|nr:hypothetical protein JZ751_004137 [Albula glossodonta]
MAVPFSLASPWRFVRSARLLQGLRIPALQLHTTGSAMGATVEDFNQAKAKLSTLKEDPGNEVKLKIYGLFKQATQGPCNTPKPSMLDFVNKAKWDAWKSLGSVSQEEARQQYVDLISSLVAAEAPDQAAEKPAGGAAAFETLLVTTEDNITTICLNRPTKKNAITVEMYNEIIKALELAGKDDSVITVLTGSGDFYCSGNDLNNFTKIPEGGIEKMAKDSGELLSQLGQSPEGCSSYTFPKMMGLAKASEMLLFNKKLTATEACERGLVTEVFPDSSFQTEVWTRLKAYGKLPRNSLALSKQLVRGVEKERLHAVNDQEVERLVERWLSDECMNAIMSFFQAKAKL